MLPMILADGVKSSLWLPERASAIAPSIDALFNFVLFINVFFVALVTVLLVYFAVKYRHRKTGNPDHLKTAGHSTALELTWTIIPIIIVLVIYILGFRGYMRMANPPASAYDITATGHMWNWSFTYPNGHVDSELHVPRGEPVRITLQSQDVIHSLFIPAMRVKKDVVPGRWNELWFTPTSDGKFGVECAAYCGTGHSKMRAECFVQERSDFDQWLKVASVWTGRVAPAVEGEKLYHDMGCSSCHSTDGTKIVGPSWLNLYGMEQQQTDGLPTVKVDNNYILHVVWDPGATLHVPGYQMVMPSFRGQLAQEDVGAIIAYMETISKYYTGDKKVLMMVAPPTTKPTTRGAPITPAAQVEPVPAGGSK